MTKHPWSPLRRVLIGYRVRALLHGEDVAECFLASYLVLTGILFALPNNDTTGGAKGQRLIHDYLGGDLFMALAFIPLGLVLAGCALRPAIKSPEVQKVALLVAVGLFFFLTIIAVAAYPFTQLSVLWGLMALLAMGTYLHVDRD